MYRISAADYSFRVSPVYKWVRFMSSSAVFLVHGAQRCLSGFCTFGSWWVKTSGFALLQRILLHYVLVRRNKQNVVHFGLSKCTIFRRHRVSWVMFGLWGGRGEFCNVAAKKASLTRPTSLCREAKVGNGSFSSSLSSPNLLFTTWCPVVQFL